jgi:hypothetical protein
VRLCPPLSNIYLTSCGATAMSPSLALCRVPTSSILLATLPTLVSPNVTPQVSFMLVLNMGKSLPPSPHLVLGFFRSLLFASALALLRFFSSKECFCGNSLDNGGVPAPLPDCSFACPGNGAQKCGAGGRMNLYSKTGNPPPPPAPGVGAWQYKGCWR